MSQHESIDEAPGSGGVVELIYVSWGGTGRGETLRQALNEAKERGLKLLYLAVLDDSTFSDIDDAMLSLAREELEWLLTAQISLTKDELSAQQVATRILVRDGDVSSQIVEVADVVGAAEVLVGAPVPLSSDETIEDFIEQLSSIVSKPVRVIKPE